MHMIASEPVVDGEPWAEIPEDHMRPSTERLHARLSPIALIPAGHRRHRDAHTVDTRRLRSTTSKREAGRPSLCLHGFPLEWWSLAAPDSRLPRRSRFSRSWMPDQRGYNDTDKGRDPYDVNQARGDVCRLIASLGAGPKARIVAHDWGGIVAWQLPRRGPTVRKKSGSAVLNCPHPSHAIEHGGGRAS